MSDPYILSAGPWDWPEDFSGENGQYQNKCTTCGKLFTGHKRRVTCKLCANPAPAPSAPDAVREIATQIARIVSASLSSDLRKRFTVDEAIEKAATLITAHVAKETAEALRKNTRLAIYESVRSDVLKYLPKEKSEKMQIAHLMDLWMVYENTKSQETATLTAKVERMRKALMDISCGTDHGDQEPCPICAICDAALADEEATHG
jgi:rubrerythrin